jgi:hypothetical protein
LPGGGNCCIVPKSEPVPAAPLPPAGAPAPAIAAAAACPLGLPYACIVLEESPSYPVPVSDARISRLPADGIPGVPGADGCPGGGYALLGCSPSGDVPP